MRISDWSSDVCSSDLAYSAFVTGTRATANGRTVARRTGNSSCRWSDPIVNVAPGNSTNAVAEGPSLSSRAMRSSVKLVTSRCYLSAQARSGRDASAEPDAQPDAQPDSGPDSGMQL